MSVTVSMYHKTCLLTSAYNEKKKKQYFLKGGNSDFPKKFRRVKLFPFLVIYKLLKMK